MNVEAAVFKAPAVPHSSAVCFTQRFHQQSVDDEALRVDNTVSLVWISDCTTGNSELLSKAIC